MAPLDWGLGHATRCIPIIQQLKQQGFDVFVAAEGKISSLLQEEFPDIRILTLRGYRIRYSRHKRFFLFRILLQLLPIWLSIRSERRWLSKIITLHDIDAVISDNRLGFCTKQIPSYFITHQLSIKSGVRWLDGIVQKINYHYINQFTECWVPDREGKDNLAGELSHPKVMPAIPVKYIGVLSRFKKTAKEKKYKIAFILSGPEPQRTMFEQVILQQIKDIDKPFALVWGLPGEENKNSSSLPAFNNSNAAIYHHLKGEELSSLMQASELVVARAGYSTIMDLVTIRQKALLVPTPGQTEQEYLAKYLAESDLFSTVEQKNLQLKKML